MNSSSRPTRPSGEPDEGLGLDLVKSESGKKSRRSEISPWQLANDQNPIVFDREAPKIQQEIFGPFSGTLLRGFHVVHPRGISMTAEVPDGSFMVVLNLQGAIMFKVDGDSKVNLFPANCIALHRGPITIQLRPSAGIYRFDRVDFAADSNTAFARWLSDGMNVQAGLHTRTAHFGQVRQAMKRLQKAKTLEVAEAEPLMMSALWEIGGALKNRSTRFSIVDVDEDAPPGVLALARRLKADPTARISLAEAASEAGYSLYHFSRMFKETLGFGFVEFVKLCRADMAINLVISGEAASREVTSLTGFQSRRELDRTLVDTTGFTIGEIEEATSKLST